MARETKVGLLAGLAFIVCFAIILTNRGRGVKNNLESAVNPRVAVQSNANRPNSNRSNARRTPLRNSTNVRNTPARTASRPRNRTTPKPNPARSVNSPRTSPYRSDNRAAQTGTNRPGQLRETRNRQASKFADSSIGANKTNLTGQQQPVVNRRAATPSTSLPQRDSRQSSDNNLRQLELKIAQLTNQLESAKNRSSSPLQKPADNTNAHARNQPVGVGAGRIIKTKDESPMYVVVAGDTLSKIAKKYYGHGTKQYIDKIVGANRSVLANPNVVRIGDELFLPGVPVVKVGQAKKTRRTTKPVQVVAAKPRNMKRANHQTNKKSSTPSDWKWYEIKKNDRYISIAREQLGDAERWPEIHELNKEKFSDPSRIRSGVRIKLPTMTLASASQERNR